MKSKLKVDILRGLSVRYKIQLLLNSLVFLDTLHEAIQPKEFNVVCQICVWHRFFNSMIQKSTSPLVKYSNYVSLLDSILYFNWQIWNKSICTINKTYLNILSFTDKAIPVLECKLRYLTSRLSFPPRVSNTSVDPTWSTILSKHFIGFTFLITLLGFFTNSAHTWNDGVSDIASGYFSTHIAPHLQRCVLCYFHRSLPQSSISIGRLQLW